MFQSIIESAKAEPGKYHFEVSGRRLDMNKATDYLWLTDEVFFAEALRRQQNDKLHQRLHDVRYRRFLVRALTISNDTVDGDDGAEEDSKVGYIQLRKLNQRGIQFFEAKRNLARDIIAAAGLDRELEPADVWIDLPSDPAFGEADRTFVRTAAGTLRKVSDLFPIHYWSDFYRLYKWRGHVFCPQEYQQKIHEASLEVFKNQFELLFKRSAGETSHVPNPKATA